MPGCWACLQASSNRYDCTKIAESNVCHFSSKQSRGSYLLVSEWERTRAYATRLPNTKAVESALIAQKKCSQLPGLKSGPQRVQSLHVRFESRWNGPQNYHGSSLLPKAETP
jgi:hypothetical protein